MTADVIKSICEEEIRKFALYDPAHEVLVHPIGKGKTSGNEHWWIGYRTHPSNIPDGSTHFDLNLCDDILYLLHIELLREHRGKGHGSQLYQVVEAIAKRLKCSMLEQTPSGWTPSGDTRAKYLERRGYTIQHNVAIKRFENAA